MATLRSLRHAFAAVFAFALLAIGATDAHATHFRYGTIRWEKTAEDANTITVLVTTESAWRCTFFVTAPQTCANLPAVVPTQQILVVQRIVSPLNLFQNNLNITRSSINNLEDWFVGSSQHTFTILKTDLPVRLFWDGNARISSLLDGNNDQAFRVESIVSNNLANSASAASSILPIITVGVGPAVKFFIPAADVQNDTLTWSIAPLARSHLVKAKPDGNPDGQNVFNIDPATGEVTWATNREGTPPAGGFLYAVQFIVTDSKGAETPIDALLRLVPTTGTPPQALINGLNVAHHVNVRPNNPVLFTVTGSDVDPGATVTLNSGALPPGATMSPTLPTTASTPVNSVFQWTPTLAQAGNNFVISFSATDNFGLQDTNSATITVLNNFPPVATCLAPVSVEATGPTGATRTLTTTVSDPDGDGVTVRWFVDTVLVQTDTVPASTGSTTVSMTRLYAIGAHPVRVEVNDGLEVSQCTTSVTVTDGAPIVTVPNTSAEATSAAGAVVTFVATAFDIVDGPIATVSCSPASGSTFPVGATLVTCTAVDSHGNTGTGTGTVTVVDTTGPVVTVPNTTAEATSSAGAVVTFVATASDIVDGNVTPVICSPASGSTFPLGATLVTCTATDSHGNPGTGTGTVTVVDTTGPVVTVPNTTAEATSPAGAIVNFVATAVDAVEGNITPVNCTPASGSTFPLGNTLVTCTAADSHGTIGTGTGTMTVVDTTGPEVTVPNTTAEATGPLGAIVTFTATAFDLVDGNIALVTCAPPSGSTFPLGATAVMCGANDTRGNHGKGTGTVTVVDTTGPVVTVPNTTAEATSAAGAVVTFVATAFDLVEGNVTPVNCTPASGSTFPLGATTVTCTAADSHGTIGTGTGTVTVVDTTGPVVTVPNTTAEATSAAGAVVTFVATAVDAVDGNIAVSCTPASGSTFPLGATTVTCTATDSHGNPGSGTGTVTVVDTTPPVITVPGPIVREATGPTGAVVTYTATATDIVDGSVTPTCVQASGTTFAIFLPEAPITVRCNAVDAHGNPAIERTFTVTVRDTTKPDIHNLPGNITASPTSPAGAVVNWPPPNATDIVDLTVPVFCTPPSGSLFPLGTTTVNCRATDAHGNRRDASFTVTVADSTPPVVTVTLNPGDLWPPDHKMVNVNVTVRTADNDPNPSCVITQVTSNQPVNGTGDGDTDVDWAFNGLNLKLRRERAGNAGRDAIRVYTVTVSCTDSAGNVGTGTGTARVVHDQGNDSGFMGLNLK